MQVVILEFQWALDLCTVASYSVMISNRLECNVASSVHILMEISFICALALKDEKKKKLQNLPQHLHNQRVVSDASAVQWLDEQNCQDPMYICRHVTSSLGTAICFCLQGEQIV